MSRGILALGRYPRASDPSASGGVSGSYRKWFALFALINKIDIP